MRASRNASGAEQVTPDTVLGVTRSDDLPEAGGGFLLAQVGAHAAARFAERLDEHDLTPPLVGILRLLRITPGQSQQALAERLGLLPSRVVAFVDELEERGLVRRERSRADRRINTLAITPAGTAALRTVRSVVRAHEKALFAGISAAERKTLTALLQRIADEQGLTRGVHPGYRALGSDRGPAGKRPSSDR